MEEKGLEMAECSEEEADEEDENVKNAKKKRANDSKYSNAVEVDDRIKLYVEKWPGKVCVLCNLGERSQLGQGDFRKIILPDSLCINDKKEPDIKEETDAKIIRKNSKCGTAPPLSLFEPIDELGVIGHKEELPLSALIDETNSIYIHYHCAVFTSQNILVKSEETEIKTAEQIERIVYELRSGLSKVCDYCSRFGASLGCFYDDCHRYYHFPCSAASAGFQYAQSWTIVCSQHLDYIPLMPSLSEVLCKSCHSLGDITNLIMCCSCHSHFHGTCSGLALLPGVRSGWQCSDCKICQICRQVGDVTKIIVCETCEKVYHSSCIRPAMSFIPKVGWKCKCCRMCNDCGSRTPGSGTSSRWHLHFTVCDSCYQLRNKGFSCPLCHKAYRMGASKEMVQCSSCGKYVHGACDPDADFANFQKKIEFCPEYQYFCLLCKNLNQYQRSNFKKTDDVDSLLQDSFMLEDGEMDMRDLAHGDGDGMKFSFGLGKGKPFTVKNRLSPKGVRLKGKGKALGVAVGYQKKNQKLAEFGRKRCNKAKMRGVFGAPGLGLQRPANDTKVDCTHIVKDTNKVILCSLEDKFCLEQDICAMCGAFGMDQEGCLISCVQCGQCYHPYCVNVKVTKVILEKGWRCLDCTVCEGCGQRTDESRLILCDDCDLSFHIYCMEPKLDYVPQGSWKCKWCVHCVTCGSNEPGVNSTWLKNYTECGPCASRLVCPFCTLPYNEGDVIIKCMHCERWLHGSCDQIKSEQDAEKCAHEGYTCILCRPKDQPPPHMVILPSTPSPVPANTTPKGKSGSISPIKAFEFTEHILDGVHLTDAGYSNISTLICAMREKESQPMRKKRVSKQISGVSQGMLESIESVVAAAANEYETVASSSPLITYKEGMVIEAAEDGKAPEPPEGFNIYTNESGVMVLRRKRIRKIGVGGFNAKMRGLKPCKEKLADEETLEFGADDTIVPTTVAAPPSSPAKEKEEKEEKTRKRKNTRKPKSKFAESYPIYIQDAFFGRDLLDSGKSDGLDLVSEDELEQIIRKSPKGMKNRIAHDTEDKPFDQVMPLANETKCILHISEPSGLVDVAGGGNQKDELADILGPNFNIESMVHENAGLPTMDGKDVEEIFKGVLTEEPERFQRQQQTQAILVGVQNQRNFMMPTAQNAPPMIAVPHSGSHIQRQQQNIPSPASYPAASPYHSEYSNSPSQFSPAFSEPPSPWTTTSATGVTTPAIEDPAIQVGSSADSTLPSSSSYNLKSSKKMENDEPLGADACISAVLYANLTFPELKTEYPVWHDRWKQILKKWRTCPTDKKGPFLSQARENRAKLRMKKSQMLGNDEKMRGAVVSTGLMPPEASNGEGRSGDFVQALDASEGDVLGDEKLSEGNETLFQAKSDDGCDVQLLEQAPPFTDEDSFAPPSVPLEPVSFQTSILDQVAYQQQGRDTCSPLLEEGTTQQTVSTTIASHPSTIQYIPIIQTKTKSNSGTAAPAPTLSRTTVHLISVASDTKTTDSHQQQQQPVRYQYVSVDSGGTTTLHYPAPNLQILQSVPLILRSAAGEVTPTTSVVQLIPSNVVRNIQVLTTNAAAKAVAEEESSTGEVEGELMDQNIRIFTPSEIMKTLPTLEFCNDSATMDSENKAKTATSSKELEQEKQWKELQAMRQQQITQESPLPTGSGAVRPQRFHMPKMNVSLPMGTGQSFPRMQISSDVFLNQQPTRPQQFFVNVAGSQKQQQQVGSQFLRQQRTSMDVDMYSNSADVTRQLRELLQRQQPSMEQQNSHARWVQDQSDNHQVTPSDFVQNAVFPDNGDPIGHQLPPISANASVSVVGNLQQQPLDNVGIATQIFRPPLPPSRTPRLPFAMNHQTRNSQLQINQQQRLLIQQQDAGIHQQPILPSMNESPNRAAVNMMDASSFNEQQSGMVVSDNVEMQEIPESVTADLERLEREGVVTGTLTDSVSFLELLDDDILGEMGSDFDILKYADPELDNFVPGEKNIFDLVDDNQISAKRDCELNSGECEIKIESGENQPVSIIGDHSLQIGENKNVQQIHLIRSQMRQEHIHVGDNIQSSQQQTQNQQQQRLLQMQRMGIREGMLQARCVQPTKVDLDVIVPPPPPPPYPGQPPPPPYPSQVKQPSICGTNRVTACNLVRTSSQRLQLTNLNLPDMPPPPSLPRRPLLLQEQPLLLEDLLEQEKQEQKKQQNVSPSGGASSLNLPPLSDADFERLRADVLNASSASIPQQQITHVARIANTTNTPFPNCPQQQQKWPSSNPSSVPTTPPQHLSSASPPETPSKIPIFNAPSLIIPAEPADKIITEEDKAAQRLYEQWLEKQNDVCQQQLKYYEAEILKLRKGRKSMSSRQRILRKQGNELPEKDACELQRITTELSALQKHLDNSRKMCKQHAGILQDYQKKHPEAVLNCGSAVATAATTTVGVSNAVFQQKSLNVAAHRSPSVANQNEESFNNSIELRQGAATSIPQLRMGQMPRVQGDHVIRYPIRFVRPKQGVISTQVPAEGVPKQQGSFHGAKGMAGVLKTQPVIVSAATTVQAGTCSLSLPVVASGELHQQQGGQQHFQRNALRPQNEETAAAVQRQKCIIQQRHAIIQQINLIHQRLSDPNAANMSDAMRQQLKDQRLALVKKQKELAQLQHAELTPRQKQLLSAQRQQSIAAAVTNSTPSGQQFGSPPPSSPLAPPQSPFSQYTNSPVMMRPSSALAMPQDGPEYGGNGVTSSSAGGGASNGQQFGPPPPSSPLAPQSPFHQYANSPVMMRPSSALAMPQEGQEYGGNGVTSSSAGGGGGGGGGGFTNTIPIPIEFQKLGIKGGLLGGCPGRVSATKMTATGAAEEYFHVEEEIGGDQEQEREVAYLDDNSLPFYNDVDMMSACKDEVEVSYHVANEALDTDDIVIDAEADMDDGEEEGDLMNDTSELESIMLLESEDVIRDTGAVGSTVMSPHLFHSYAKIQQTMPGEGKQVEVNDEVLEACPLPLPVLGIPAESLSEENNLIDATNAPVSPQIEQCKAVPDEGKHVEVNDEVLEACPLPLSVVGIPAESLSEENNVIDTTNAPVSPQIEQCKAVPGEGKHVEVNDEVLEACPLPLPVVGIPTESLPKENSVIDAANAPVSPQIEQCKTPPHFLSFLKTADECHIDIESDKRLFDETLLKIKMEKYATEGKGMEEYATGGNVSSKNDDNVLLKQLLQNTSAAVVHSGMLMHSPSQQQHHFPPFDQSHSLQRSSGSAFQTPGIYNKMQDSSSDAGDTPNSISGDSSCGSGSVLDSNDLKKMKRRQYQAKRKQSQSSKEAPPVAKKRSRRVSKLDEDYDTFVDTLMANMRCLPNLPITEPFISNNFVTCPAYGIGDLSKPISPRMWFQGELQGAFDKCFIPGVGDLYSMDPFGELELTKLATIPSTQRDFYYNEFSPLNLDADYEERQLEIARLQRETDTPDSIVSSSSPECIIPHTPVRFQGLRLIDDNDGASSEEEENILRGTSPVIPIVAPLALKPRPSYTAEDDKENVRREMAHVFFKAKVEKDAMDGVMDGDEKGGEMSVTLTISSEAALNVVGILKNLANILNIPPPMSYKVAERIPSPQRSEKNKSNSEKCQQGVKNEPSSEPLVRYCDQCDTPILNKVSIKKRRQEVPFVVTDGKAEDLYFCSASCYLQMQLLHPTVVSHHQMPTGQAENTSEPSEKVKFSDGSDELEEPLENELPPAYKFQMTDLPPNMNINEELERGFSAMEAMDDMEASSMSESADKKPAKGILYRQWSSASLPPLSQKRRQLTEKEITEMLFRMRVTVLPAIIPEDVRECEFCHQVGDGLADGTSRLLNYDVNKWVHLNCTLWSDGVYETVNGALMNVEAALQLGSKVSCMYCHSKGATLKCFKLRCSSVYHLSCAVKDQCVFFKNKSIYCHIHVPKGEKDSELTTLAVFRRVYVDRNENRQIASIVQHSELTHLMRIGSMIFLNVGQLLPQQLQEFHTPNYIYPVGYKIIRFYWSMRVFNKRCQYVCSIRDSGGRPEFHVLVREEGFENHEVKGPTPRAVWTRILEPLANLRRSNDSVKNYPKFVTGEDLYGLTEPAIVRILESLPGIETLQDYKYKYGKDPLLELPLAVNPTGCARSEPRIPSVKQRGSIKQRTTSIMPRPVFTSAPILINDTCPYSKQFVHSKSQQYKKMKQEWRSNVYLAKSNIQGLGLYAARDIEKHTMIIEYIGEIIRSELSDFREKKYEIKNRGVYMFRLDEDRVVDATISGGLAKYINHSCNPNCITEKVEVDREYRIIISAKRRIMRGEELSYDYQFDIEDDQHKIPCLCGALNCRKWMN